MKALEDLTKTSPMPITLDEMSTSMRNFGFYDYAVFGVMLTICGAIGVYFGFVKKTSGESDYLMGGRTMKVLPVGMSLVSGFFSGISILGIPTEIYLHGTAYVFICLGLLLDSAVIAYIYLPVLHDLKLTSSYEYLERRFNRKLRLLGSILFSINIILWLPMVIYMPALALNQVTGINVHILTPFVCVICIFYTCVGGLKAVVWTDFIQTFFMFGTLILIVVKGTIDLGGLDVVLHRNIRSGRIESPSSDVDFLKRHTVWSLVVGSFFYWLQDAALHQSMVQRYSSLPNLKAARKALVFFVAGAIALITLCCYIGLLTYAWYHECDPLTTKLINTKDQLLPLLVMDTLGKFPGIPGLFISGIFSAALSSLSTGLNSMAAVALEDFVKPYKRKPLTSRQIDIFMKLTVVIVGFICVALVLVVEKAGSHVLQLCFTLTSVTNGPALGIFSMGILIPWVNSKGALTGGIFGLGFMSWLAFSAEAAIANGKIKFESKPITTEGCTYQFPPIQHSIDVNQLNEIDETLTEPFALFRVSYLWYTAIGSTITVCIGLVISLLSPQDPDQLDPNLVAPFIRKYLILRRKGNKEKILHNNENDLDTDSDVLNHTILDESEMIALQEQKRKHSTMMKTNSD